MSFLIKGCREANSLHGFLRDTEVKNRDLLKRSKSYKMGWCKSIWTQVQKGRNANSLLGIRNDSKKMELLIFQKGSIVKNALVSSAALK